MGKVSETGEMGSEIRYNKAMKKRPSKPQGPCEACGIPLSGHPKCVACGILFGRDHLVETSVKAEGHDLCPYCYSQWKTRHPKLGLNEWLKIALRGEPVDTKTKQA